MTPILAQLEKASLSFWVENALIIVGGFILLSLTMRVLEMLIKKKVQSSLPISPILIAIKWAGVLIITSLVLERFDIHVMTMLTTVLAMVAVGVIAVWSILSHIMATFILMITKPFRVHDVIGFVGEEIKGEVIDLNLFYTTLLSEDGDEFRVPNNMFFQKSLRVKKGPGKTELDEQFQEKTAAAPEIMPESEKPATEA
ncbi:mechanosensitive ion channel family protein [Cerasicoccus fimbriatus]|uniref:mechanosensitive ion channel family protein n=1 Tax=Cerasicoccus fimbriatus TaxID=3014554 RepID=UPI0022B3C3F5|nr:mechanosensitive ion channel family protein [Cerasicoccus sp. TK19100]